MSAKKDEKIEEEEISSKNNLKCPTKKKNKKLDIFDKKFQCAQKITLLDIFNDNVDIKQYYKENKQKIQPNFDKQKDNHTNQTNIHENSINISSFNDFDIFNFTSEDEVEDPKIKEEREEIIKKMEQRTDEIIPPKDFNIFDFSKLLINLDEPLIYDKIKTTDSETIGHNDKTTKSSTHKGNPAIKLIKKVDKKNGEKAQKRMNKFKRMEQFGRNGKSKSIENKERSRSKE